MAVTYWVCGCLHGLLELLRVVENLSKLWVAVHQLQTGEDTYLLVRGLGLLGRQIGAIHCLRPGCKST